MLHSPSIQRLFVTGVILLLAAWNVGRITSYLSSSNKTWWTVMHHSNPKDITSPTFTISGGIKHTTIVNDCATQNQMRLLTPPFGHLDLMVMVGGEDDLSWSAGTAVRIPVLNLARRASTTDHANNTQHWQYSLWARLVSSDQLIDVTHIDYYNDKTSSSSHKEAELFAELEFHVYSPGTYQLQVEVRYLYGNHMGGKYGLTNTSLFSHQLLSRVKQGNLFSFSGNIVDFLAQNFGNEVPVIYMARENDLETWRNTSGMKDNITASWPKYHANWVNNHCLSIRGSPYEIHIVGSNSSSIHNPVDFVVEQDQPSSTSMRMCTASDTMKPGFWRRVNASSCATDLSYPCHYFRVPKTGVGYVYETPGCHWELPNVTRLSTCFQKYGNRLNLIGDSLMRQLNTALLDYFTFLNFKQVAIGRAYKKKGETHHASGHSFSMNEGVFIDDFEVVHKVGWGTNRDMTGGESSPGRLARDLAAHKAWFINATTSAATSMRTGNQSSSVRFVYYVPNYVNDFRVRQSFEPFMSFYSALTGEFLSSELGYDIFNANKILRGLPEETHDGLHYSPHVIRFLAIMMLNSLCPSSS